MASGRNGPAQDLRTVLRWLAVFSGIEIADAVLTALLGVPGEAPPWHPGWLHGGYLDVLLGLRPRDGWGAIGIITAPFLHAGWGHLVANALALTLLLLLSLRYSRRLTWWACAISSGAAGGLTWVIAPAHTIHVGASGVIFGLVGWLLVNGLVRRDWVAFLIAVLVALLYGSALTGMVPGMADPHISWQMHLGGFLGGITASWMLRRSRP